MCIKGGTKAYKDDSLIVFVQHHKLHHAKLVECMLRDIVAKGIMVDRSLIFSKKEGGSQKSQGGSIGRNDFFQKYEFARYIIQDKSQVNGVKTRIENNGDANVAEKEEEGNEEDKDG
eukprot:3027372-Ditylum_brightwellii.AAC.1